MDLAARGKRMDKHLRSDCEAACNGEVPSCKDDNGSQLEIQENRGVG